MPLSFHYFSTLMKFCSEITMVLWSLLGGVERDGHSKEFTQRVSIAPSSKDYPSPARKSRRPAGLSNYIDSLLDPRHPNTNSRQHILRTPIKLSGQP